MVEVIKECFRDDIGAKSRTKLINTMNNRISGQWYWIVTKALHSIMGEKETRKLVI